MFASAPTELWTPNGHAKPRKPTVFGWKADTSGCGHYRIDVPFEELASRGWTVTASTLLDNRRITADLVIAQRSCMPRATEFLQDMMRRGVPVAVDIDDLLTNVDPSNENAYAFYMNGHVRENLEENLRNAVVVIASTVALAQRMQKYNQNVYVVPNCAPRSLLDQPVAEEHQNRRASGKVTIGWAGSPTHKQDFNEIAYPLRRSLAWNKDTADLLLIGADYSDLVRMPDQTRHMPWLDGVTDYYQTLDNIDIGLAPLMPSEFNTCKSPVKALEYAARGIPVIASDYGPYADFVVDGETGFLCSSQVQWMDALNHLIRDDSARAQMSRNARRQAELMAINHHANRYERLFEAMAANL